MASEAPVFIDHSGRRWRRIRRAVLALGVVTSLIGLLMVLGILIPDAIPELHPRVGTPNHPITSRAQRLRIQLRRQLFEAAARSGRPTPSRRTAGIPALAVGNLHAPRRDNPIVAGFYVNWEDDSYASLQTHLRQLDWVVLEWGFTARAGDSLIVAPDHRIVDLIAQEPKDDRPQLFLMVSNFDTTSKVFCPTCLRTLLTRPDARARAIAQLRGAVETYGLAGVVVDFEEIPGLEGASLQFARELRGALGAGRQVGMAVPMGMSDGELRDVGASLDWVLAMIFDEHWGAGTPGPIASQEFYARQLRRLASLVPPQKLIPMVGAYGYDWNDAPPEKGQRKIAIERTFQEVVTALRDSGGTDHFDAASLNPYVTYTSPDSTDHVVWYLDGATAYNEIRLGESVGAAGMAVWRLGSEDPSIWGALDRAGHLGKADALREVPAGYYPEIENSGEILRVRARPTAGARTVAVDAAGLVTGERFTEYPTPYIVQRFGVQEQHPHWVALTFDDGPDGRWTPQILDTLAARGAKATFFVIGENADAHVRLLRREYAEGHEIGNHTYYHPNLGLTSNTRTRIELDATTRLIEALLGRGTALFRPPYFGDAEPTTAEELDPVAVASDRGLLTVGLHVDSEDWQSGTTVDSIVQYVLRSRPDPDDPNDLACRDSLARRDTRSCNVVLLHDGGGNRARTVAALGMLIDSLRARGDTLVLVSQLAGLTRDQAMPPLPRVGQARRLLEASGFIVYGVLEWLMFWVFTIAVVLGIGRLAFIGFLAIIQRAKRHQHRGAPTTFAPAVSVIVPAYNEEKVICQTIESLLAQKYAGALEVVVVDDGSRDRTYAVARDRFADHPQVAVLTKQNGGKASALNFGIARAHHEVVICLDADTLFAADTVAELVQPLADPAVGAVAGNAKVGNRINLVTRWQALEYVTSQNLDRRAFSLLDCITVVPGAVGAWRRDAVLRVGGFRDDTLAEDQDLTLAVRRAGYSVAYADGAVAYTEAPDTLRGLAKQRFRWSFGTLQCAWKHRDALFRYGALGRVALPNVWLFQLLLPAISPIADLMFVWSLVSVWLNARSHTAGNQLTYALVNLEQVLAYYAIFLLVDWLASIIAFLMEPGEDKQLTWLVLLQRFAYRQVMYWVVVRSFAAAFRGRVVGWGKLERKATVEVGTAGARG